MKKMLMVMLMLIEAVSDGKAQPDSLWSRTFGGGSDDQCYSLIQTADGGFALVGVTYSSGVDTVDFWLVRTNEDGDSLWSRTFGGWCSDWCASIIQTADGGFVLAGNTFFEGGWDFWLVRTNAQGDRIWSHTFGGERHDECSSIIQTADGGFALAGGTSSFGAGGYDFWLLRTNADGDSLWARTFGGGDDDYCHSLIQTTDGGFALAGYTDSFGAGLDNFWLVRTNADGDSLWSRTFGGERSEWCYSLLQTADMGFALAGHTYSFGAGLDDFWLARTNAEGDSLWSCTFGGRSDDLCYSIIQTEDGGFVLAGVTGSSYRGIYDTWLVKTGADPVSVFDRPLTPYTLHLDLFPNPFNASTTLTYSLPRRAPMELGIYDLSGRLIETLAAGVAEAGEHSVVWTAPGSGVYFAVLKVEGEGKAVRKVVCVR